MRKDKYIKLLGLLNVICLILLFIGCSKTEDSSKINNSTVNNGQVTNNDVTAVTGNDNESSQADITGSSETAMEDDGNQEEAVNNEDAEETVFEGLISKNQTPLLGSKNSYGLDYGYICAIGDTIYYRNDKDHGYLYKLDMDGKKSKIYEAAVNHINMMGDYLYFINENNNNSICKVGLNGENYNVISSVRASWLLLTPDQIFYTADDMFLSRMSLDGQQVTHLTKNTSASGNYIYNNYLIHGGEMIDSGLFCYDLTSDKDYKILDNCFFPVVEGDYLYYQSEDGIMQCNLIDGSNKLLTGQWGNQFVIVQNYLYFMDSYSIWRYSLDGTKQSEEIFTTVNKDDPNHWEYLDIKINWMCGGMKDIFYNVTEDGADKIYIYHIDKGITEEL